MLETGVVVLVTTAVVVLVSNGFVMRVTSGGPGIVEDSLTSDSPCN
jgi:hypothetical protein